VDSRLSLRSTQPPAVLAGDRVNVTRSVAVFGYRSSGS
jgi:hypothetical protein